MEAKSGNIATNELTSPKMLGTSLNSSMGKSAGKWASTPPLLPIKSYAAVEPELMKEIEKLQHRRTRSSFSPSPPSHVSAHWFLSFSLRPSTFSRLVSLFLLPTLLVPLISRTRYAPQPRLERTNRHPRNSRKRKGSKTKLKSLSGVDRNSSG